jgi:hypothetical protein
MEPSCIAGGDLALNVNKSTTTTELGMGISLSVPSFQEAVSKEEALQQPLLALYVRPIT